MRSIKLKSSILNSDIVVFPDAIFYHYFSESRKTTILVSRQGAQAPVDASVEEITRLISESITNPKEVLDGSGTK